ncbi:MAG: ABC transporter ATP-binding protein/permease [Clostridiales bacterium]|nr:ABC transporter ATP-binding protein/permease [Clostridiales bacterium]
MSKTRNTEGSFRLIWTFLKGSKAFFVISILSAAFNALMDMLSPQIIRMTVDNVIEGQEPTYSAWIMRLVNALGGFEHIKNNIWIAAAALMLVALIKVIAQYLFRVYNTKGSETLVKTMRDTLFGHIERLPFSWHMKNKTGDIIQRCTSDIETMRNFISEQMTGIFRIVIMLVMSLVFMLAMNPLLTLVAMIPMPILILHSMAFHKTVYTEFEKCDENEGKLSAMVQENLTGVRVVRAFGREKTELDKFEKQNKYYTSLWVRVGKSLSRFWSISDLIANAQVMILVVVGAILCYKGRMLTGEYIAFISYNARLIWPVRQLGRMISELSKATVSVQRVKYIMDSKEECDDPDAYEADMHGDIKFENVCFNYDNCPELLHDVSFTVKKGTTLGILGGTGSGKSTLMFLLDKLYDLPEGGGSITIGGVDIRKISTEHLRSNIGIVLQEPFLFSRTISENIGITDEKLTLSDIREAAKDACLDDSVIAFAKGYDTMVGERGVTLSGGQKQRAAIARMITQKTPIMILDDSLSAVDTQTDARIRQALEKHFGGATVIIISHRITTLSHCDQIIVMEKGRVMETGTHEQLKDAGGVYSLIYQSQTGLGEEAV